MRFRVVVLVWAFCCPNLLGQAPSLQSRSENDAADDVEKQIREILAAEYPYGSRRGAGPAGGYGALFKKIGPEGVRRLQTHAHDGVAIQAAWAEVALTVPEKEPDRAVRPDRHKLDWFLGFLEGRGRLKAPQWWAEMLLDSRANRRDNIYPGDPKKMLYHRAGLDDAQAPVDTTLTRAGDKVTLKVGKESVVIPESLLRKSDSGRVYSGVSALVMPGRCYMAEHDNWGHPYQLACIDRSTGKVAWRNEVWGIWWGAGAGVSHMSVAVTEQGDRIIVFGAGSLGIHVEAFRKDDGTNLFRFSSSY
jgi:hypothetical protein